MNIYDKVVLRFPHRIRYCIWMVVKLLSEVGLWKVWMSLDGEWSTHHMQVFVIDIKIWLFSLTRIIHWHICAWVLPSIVKKKKKNTFSNSRTYVLTSLNYFLKHFLHYFANASLNSTLVVPKIIMHNPGYLFSLHPIPEVLPHLHGRSPTFSSYGHVKRFFPRFQP